MKTGFRGTFVISWSQTELDGLWSAPCADLSDGATWRWTGEAVRVDGPAGVLPLGAATGEASIRRRAAHSVRRLVGTAMAEKRVIQMPGDHPLFETGFTLTDGHHTWTVTLIDTGLGRRPLCMFVNEIPPRNKDLWIVNHNIEPEASDVGVAESGGVICFTGQTMILTAEGAKPIEHIGEGDKIQTKDNGCQEVLWTGNRRITGARLYAMPELLPVRLLANALAEGVPDAGLLVSPDHRVMIRGAVARELFNTSEVLVAAKDLIDGRSVIVDHSVREVTYYHMLLDAHQIVFANGVETESFHPASAALSSMADADLARLYATLPEIEGDPEAYGAYARRALSKSEAAILQYAA